MTVLGVEWSFGDVLLAMLAFFVWFMLIWTFFWVFIDNFRRRDHSWWAKAPPDLRSSAVRGLIYLIARPSDVESDTSSALP